MRRWLPSRAPFGIFSMLLAATASDAGTQVCLLGTAGGPGARVERAGIASLLVVDERRYLIDAGSGVARQLAAFGVHENQIPMLFLTHLHDDHTAGLPELMTFAYTLRTSGMQIIGPPRTANLVESIVSVMQYSAEIRMAEGSITVAPAARFTGRDVMPGLAYSDESVEVTAAENSHFEIPPGSIAVRNRSYSWRFKTRDRVVVFTGDTGVSAQLESLARGADLLISESATAADLAAVPPEVKHHMQAEHLSPAEVGQLAAKAQVKAVVLSHVRNIQATDMDEVRRYFKGTATIGADLHCY